MNIIIKNITSNEFPELLNRLVNLLLNDGYETSIKTISNDNSINITGAVIEVKDDLI
jgi:hypothetical protein